VFWSRGAREARRQKVLDELMELDPADRRLRLQHAVVAGDVRSGEVDQALRLVARLDALRVMTLPLTDGMPHRSIVGSAPADPEAASIETAVAEPADWTVQLPRADIRPDTGWEPELPAHAVIALTVHSAEPVAVPIETPEATATAVTPAVPVEDDPAVAGTERTSPPAWTASEPMPLDAVESATRLMSRPRPPRRSTHAQVKIAVSDLEPATGPGERSRQPDISWLREI
jgi:hypothetical protein